MTDKRGLRSEERVDGFRRYKSALTRIAYSTELTRRPQLIPHGTNRTEFRRKRRRQAQWIFHLVLPPTSCTLDMLRDARAMFLSCCILWLILWAARAAAQEAPELVLQTGHPSFVDKLAFSSDSRTLLSHGFDGSIRVWDLSNRSIRRSWERDALAANRLQTFALSSTGEEILVRNMRSGADVVSVASGQRVGGFDPSIMSDDQRAKSPPTAIVTAVAESPDGQWRVASDDAGSIIAFSTHTNSARIVQRTGSPATDFWFNPQATRLVIARQDGSLLLFTMDMAQRAQTPPDFKLKPGTSVAITKEGDVLLATGEPGKIILSNLTKGAVQEIACRCAMEMLSGDGTP